MWKSFLDGLPWGMGAMIGFYVTGFVIVNGIRIGRLYKKEGIKYPGRTRWTNVKQVFRKHGWEWN